MNIAKSIYSIPNFISPQQFWQIADVTKMQERYRIDSNLRYLSEATLAQLQKIFIQYRYFTIYYIGDLALLISKMPFGRLRSTLAEILYEELGNGDFKQAHTQLYDDFLLSIGVANSKLQYQDQQCINILENIRQMVVHKSWIHGIGLRGMGGECLCHIYLTTMYDYFVKNPNIHRIKDQIAWKFWEIHTGDVDIHHQNLMRDVLNELIHEHPEITSDLLDSYRISQLGWDDFWLQIYNSAK